MKRRVGLLAPFVVLLGLGVFGPYLRERSDSTLLTLVLSPQAYLLAASLAIWRWFSLAPGPVSREKWSFQKQILVGTVAGLAPAALFLIAVPVARLLWGDSSDIVSARLDLSPARWTILLFLAPLAEEFFFRGILCRSIRNVYAPWVAISFSALIFTFSHGGFVLGPFVLGCITAIIYLRSQSILPGILFHSIANCYVPLMMIFFPSVLEKIRFLL